MYWTGNSIAVILYCFSGVGIKMLWEPRRERFQEEVTVYGKCVGGTTSTSLLIFMKRKTMTTSIYKKLKQG